MEYRNFPEISETEKFTLNIQFVISVAFLQTAGPAAVGPSRGRARRAPASAAARPGVGEIVEGSQRALDQILQQGGTSMRDFSIGSTVNASSHVQKIQLGRLHCLCNVCIQPNKFSVVTSSAIFDCS